MLFADATDTVRGGENASRRSEIDVLILLSTTWIDYSVLTNNDRFLSFNYYARLAITSSCARVSIERSSKIKRAAAKSKLSFVKVNY